MIVVYDIFMRQLQNINVMSDNALLAANRQLGYVIFKFYEIPMVSANLWYQGDNLNCHLTG